MDFISGHLYWFWFAVMLFMLAVEAMTVSLVTIWCAASAIVMIFISLTGMAFKWQLLIFLALSLVMIFTTRPIFIKKLHPKENSAGLNSLLGEEVVAQSRISQSCRGTAKTSNGVVWNATCLDSDDLEAGSLCIVKGLRGNTLIVRKLDKKEN